MPRNRRWLNMSAWLSMLVVVLLVGSITTGVVLASTAGQTAVHVTPETVDIDPGERTTLDVMVEPVDGGIGAWEGTFQLTDSLAVEIVDVQLAGDPQLASVELGAENSSVSFEAALAETNDTGAVTIMTVTIEGVSDGESNSVLALDALGDEDGGNYQVTEITDATIIVGTGAQATQPPTTTATADGTPDSAPNTTATTSTGAATTSATTRESTTTSANDEPTTPRSTTTRTTGTPPPDETQSHAGTTSAETPGFTTPHVLTVLLYMALHWSLRDQR